MVRPVSADHIMFQECINIFRPENTSHIVMKDNSEKIEHIVLDFELPYELNFKNFKIHPTKSINFGSSPYRSFIAPVTFLDYTVRFNSHLYTIALSSLISFVTSRPAKAPRDSYPGLLNYDALALILPNKVAGTGAVSTTIPEKKIQQFTSELDEIVNILHELPYEDYEKFMQAIRLINLAHINKRDDFALAYYLLVSAIEAIAQIAILPEITEDPQEKKWEELAQEHKPIKSLLNQFRNYRNNSDQLTKRFTKFVSQYCPSSQWFELEHQDEDRLASYGDTGDFSWLTEKKWYEVYPDDLKTKDLKKIVEDTYRYRSKFTHEGKAPPHTSPDTSERFFEKVSMWNDKKGFEEKLLINYRLLSFIAKTSILTYMRTLREQLHN
ncbi:hypothetical protein [Bacillus cereus group sp. BfR-BA-01310]|uniref:hypothetical protein n=1 Tax=Bacillus cereus group sp. BfR-BA-01310 TaxID=2920287 RepID=UPI001F577720|nr:hypothetical protein [Bacillus cereus group sp. BfR-BA-01310]